jgi:hypothetical protein
MLLPNDHPAAVHRRREDLSMGKLVAGLDLT